MFVACSFLAEAGGDGLESGHEDRFRLCESNGHTHLFGTNEGTSSLNPDVSGSLYN